MANHILHHKRDLYSDVTARILAQLEAGAAPWIKPWRLSNLMAERRGQPCQAECQGPARPRPVTNR